MHGKPARYGYYGAGNLWEEGMRGSMFPLFVFAFLPNSSLKNRSTRPVGRKPELLSGSHDMNFITVCGLAKKVGHLLL